MAIRKLGRGLDVLIPQRPGATRGKEIVSLPVNQISPNPFQPRRSFPEEDLKDLAASIRNDGVLQPILVRRTPEGYQLVSGERRLRAAKLAQLQTIPAVVIEADDRKAQELALIENLQREDLSPLEAAQGMRSLMERYSLTQEALADALGMKRSTVANTLRLLELPEKIRKGLARRDITAGHAKVLLSLQDEAAQIRLYNRIRTEGLSVRTLEELVTAETVSKPTRSKKPKPKAEPDPAVTALQDEFTRILGTKVTISHNHNKGVIHIHFFSAEDFERLRDMLRRLQ